MPNVVKNSFKINRESTEIHVLEQAKHIAIYRIVDKEIPLSQIIS